MQLKDDMHIQQKPILKLWGNYCSFKWNDCFHKVQTVLLDNAILLNNVRTLLPNQQGICINMDLHPVWPFLRNHLNLRVSSPFMWITKWNEYSISCSPLNCIFVFHSSLELLIFSFKGRREISNMNDCAVLFRLEYCFAIWKIQVLTQVRQESLQLGPFWDLSPVSTRRPCGTYCHSLRFQEVPWDSASPVVP